MYFQIPKENMDNIGYNDKISADQGMIDEANGEDTGEDTGETSDTLEHIAGFIDLLNQIEKEKKNKPAMSLASIALGLMSGGKGLQTGLGGSQSTGGIVEENP